MDYVIKYVGSHVEVYTQSGSFLFSADTTREAMEELAARLEAASAAMKERRAKLRELERKLRREED